MMKINLGSTEKYAIVKLPDGRFAVVGDVVGDEVTVYTDSNPQRLHFAKSYPWNTRVEIVQGALVVALAGLAIRKLLQAEATMFDDVKYKDHPVDDENEQDGAASDFYFEVDRENRVFGRH